MFAQVIIEYTAKSLDKTFIYEVPSILKDKIKVGMKVKVPFGNKEILGFVLELLDEVKRDFKIKKIISLVDPELVLNKELLEIANYLATTTLCSKITALQTLLPSALKAKRITHNYTLYKTYVKLNPLIDIKKYKLTNKKYLKQIAIIELLEKDKEVLKSAIKSSSLNTLIKNKVVIEGKKAMYRLNNTALETNYKLTFSQEKVYKRVINTLDKYQPFLLYGITGSGKTIVYLKIIEEVVKRGKTALVLVPEILLTMQIVKRFYEAFGNDVAILHSALSSGEKHDEYLKIMRNEVKIVIGTRSAVFAPLTNLGIIIIDEEHSLNYKQDNNPKYNAKDIALFRAKYNNIPLVLGSATPSLESMARSSKKVYELLILDKRIDGSSLPKIHIVDMFLELKKRNNILSTELKEKIKNRLEKKEQIILLLNRRGYATYVNCSNCTFVYKCPNCDITLTYHESTNNLICHYCGYQIKKADRCPKCGEEALNYYGLGTEKLEEYIKKTFPLIKVVRMDQDTTTKKGSYEAFIKDFQEHKYDMLIGTQMVSKGLDFPKVTLVGIINADNSLNIPDFRSSENTFSLLTQASGRSGRGSLKGEVIIQSFNPTNYVINNVVKNDYKAFYYEEMAIRKNLKYPPYYYLVSLKVMGKDYHIALENAQKIKDYLTSNLKKETIVLGPTTALVFKFNNLYRFQILIKYKIDEKLYPVLKDVVNLYTLNNNINIDIDFNPSHL